MTRMSHGWTDVPVIIEDVALDALASAFRGKVAVREVWLIGSLIKRETEQHVSLTVACVVEDPSAPRSVAVDRLCERLSAIAEQHGLKIRNWAYVDPETARPAFAEHGIRLYPVAAEK